MKDKIVTIHQDHSRRIGIERLPIDFHLAQTANKNKSVGSPISFDIRLGIYTLNSLRRDPVEPRVTPHSSGN